MQQVIVIRKHIGGCVPSIAGIGGYRLEDDVTIITTARGSEIRVVGTRSAINGVDFTDETPKSDHETIVAFWQIEAERWAAEAAHLATPDTTEVESDVVTAPGVDKVTFGASLVCFRSNSTMPSTPAGIDVVLVEGARTGQRSQITQYGCECQKLQAHGRCNRRATVFELAGPVEAEAHVNLLHGPDEVDSAGSAAPDRQRPAEVA